MAIYGAFSPSMLAMMSQSTSLSNIGTNIANINTGGYKKTDTHFATVLSRTIQNVSDIGGVQPKMYQRIDKGGVLISSDRNLDAAVSGHGMFVLNSELDGSGQTFFTRDGSFQTKAGADISVTADDGTSTITTQESYLVDKNGYYVMAWQPQADGTFNITSPMQAMRVDAYAFQANSIATTQANLDLNLPAADAEGSSRLYSMRFFDSNGTERTVTLDFVKQATANTWTATQKWNDTPTSQVDTVNLVGSVEAGDVYTISVNGASVNYTATGAEASMSAIRDNLLSLITNHPTLGSLVSAATSGTSDITLTARTPGTNLTTIATSTQALADVAREDTVTLSGGVVVGDVYSVTINGVTFSATAGGGDTLETLRDAILNDINTSVPADPLVTAVANGTDGIDLISDTPGVDYTLSTATTDAGGAPAAGFAIVSVATNYTALTDNLPTSATTTVLNDTGARTGAATTLTFDSNAQLVSPTSIAISANWADGGTVSSNLDISAVTQFAGAFNPFSYWQNGFGAGQLREISFDVKGQVQGQFSNSMTRPLYRLGLAVFANVNGLEMINGNVFKESAQSGSATIIAPDENSFGSISGNTREMSNVDVAEEFSNMIVTQQAYNSAATIFRTVDEMTVTARDLKR